MKYEKIAAGLLVVHENFQSHGEAGVIPQIRTMGIVPSRGSVKPTRTVVFINCDERANLDHLRKHEIRINQPSGRIRTAILPVSSLDPLSEDGAINRIIPAQYLHPTMDVAKSVVHVESLRNAKNLSGKGVIIGIIDTGIDANLDAFEGRILRVWDQTLPGPGVAEGGYGAELPAGLLGISRDTIGHGTHVAGIAAAAESSFGGVAPEAEYVIVKTDFMNAHIADAVRYVFRVATELHRPAVVNLSLGGHFDPHDGSDPLSAIIDEQSGRGRIVCCAAGNEGNDNIHAAARIAQGALRTIRFRVPAGGINNAVLNGWYPGNQALQVSLRSPGGFVTPFQPIIQFGQPARQYTLPDGVVTIITPRADPDNGDNNFVVDIQGRLGNDVAKGIWQLRVRNDSSGEAQLDVWTLDDQDSAAVVFTGISVNDTMKIGAPGAASKAVTVAAFTTKTEWTDISREERAVGLSLNTIADFSSEGPLRNGARKPDLAAPGAMIVSSLSSNSAPDPAYVVSNELLAMAGTSMATPYVTGLVALLLEGDRNLDPDSIKRRLCTNSRIPGQPENTFDNKWGFGLIDAAML